jgi:methionyl-tRNA synthetase
MDVFGKYRRVLITAALPYANGPIHIGHLAGVYIPADIYARYLRLRGEEVLFVCGSDEHGVPIALKAMEECVTPKKIVDRYHRIIKKSLEDFGITFDIYSRTSSSIHRHTASIFFRCLYDKGKLVEKITDQYYDARARLFLADRYIIGTCRLCGYKYAYGDQCESCGSSISVTDLLNPKSIVTNTLPEMKKTKHWYLPLDNYTKWLKKWILEEHKEWKPNVFGQCKSWLNAGLSDRAVTRDLDWGIPVPIEGVDGKVLYVWFDAPIGYISNTIEFFPNNWEKWWKDSSTKLVHFIGKDNIVFHCIIFPVMLKAHGGYILPNNVPASEFLNLEGKKISTSRNWAIWLHEYIDEFPGQEDSLRYVLIANSPENKDSDFTWKDFQIRNNNELVAILGNFINRVSVLTHKYFGGNVPFREKLTSFDQCVLNDFFSKKIIIENWLEQYRFRDALKEAMNLARIGNKYLTDTEVWKIADKISIRRATVLNVALQMIVNLTIIFDPFLPFTTAKIRKFLHKENLKWNQFGEMDLLKAGDQIDQLNLLFVKVEDETVERHVRKLFNTKS